MSHARQLIRKAVQAALIAENTAAGTRVFSTRMVPWETTDLPAVAIYTLNEPIDAESRNNSPRKLWRNLELKIEAQVIADANVEDVIDDLAVQLERAMNRDYTFGQTASDSILTNTEVNVEVIGERPVGVLELTYDVVYYTHSPEAEDAIPVSLNTIDVKTKVGGQINPTEDLYQNLET